MIDKVPNVFPDIGKSGIQPDIKSLSVHTPSAVQTPGFSPPAPAPAKKTPAPGKKLRLRQKTCEN